MNGELILANGVMVRGMIADFSNANAASLTALQHVSEEEVSVYLSGRRMFGAWGKCGTEVEVSAAAG